MAGKYSHHTDARGRLVEQTAYVCIHYQNARQACRRGCFIDLPKAHRALFTLLRELSRGPAVRLRELPTAAADDQARAILERELAAIPARRQRQIELAERGLISEEELAAARARLAAEEERLRSSLRDAPRAARPTLRVFRDLADLLESPDAPYVAKRALLKELVARIDLDSEKRPILTLRA